MEKVNFIYQFIMNEFEILFNFILIHVLLNIFIILLLNYL